MAHWLAYVPGQHGPDAAGVLRDAGLADLVGDAEPLKIDAGPDGGAGMLFAWRRGGRSGKRLAYVPGEQTWTASAARGNQPSGRYWIGVENGEPTLPEELARPTPIRGCWVPLGDGREWLLPTIDRLPGRARLQESGVWTFAVDERFSWFVCRADRYVQLLETLLEKDRLHELDRFGQGRDLAELLEFAVDALRLNYRILPEVASALGLFTRDNWCLPLVAIVTGQTGVAAFLTERDQIGSRPTADSRQPTANSPPGGRT